MWVHAEHIAAGDLYEPSQRDAPGCDDFRDIDLLQSRQRRAAGCDGREGIRHRSARRRRHSTLTGEKSTYQLCGRKNPLTRGDSAIGQTSCTIHRNTAWSINFVSILPSTASCAGPSGVSRAAAHSASSSGSLMQPQFEPFGGIIRLVANSMI